MLSWGGGLFPCADLLSRAGGPITIERKARAPGAPNRRIKKAPSADFAYSAIAAKFVDPLNFLACSGKRRLLRTAAALRTRLRPLSQKAHCRLKKMCRSQVHRLVLSRCSQSMGRRSRRTRILSVRGSIQRPKRAGISFLKNRSMRCFIWVKDGDKFAENRVKAV